MARGSAERMFAHVRVALGTVVDSAQQSSNSNSSNFGAEYRIRYPYSVKLSYPHMSPKKRLVWSDCPSIHEMATKGYAGVI